MESPENGVYQLILEAGESTPEKPFYLAGNKTICFGEALETVQKVAGFLHRKGVEKGDRVVVNLGNTPEFVYTVLALAQLGAIAVLINPVSKRFELEHYLKDTDPKLVVTISGCLDNFKFNDEFFYNPEQVVLIDDYQNFTRFWSSVKKESAYTAWTCLEPGDASAIIYTAAADGSPAGAVLSHDALYEVSKIFAETVLDTDVFITALPLCHSFGFVSSFMIPLFSRVPFYLLGNFTPQSLVDVLRMQKITIFTGTPVMFLAIEKRLEIYKNALSTRAWICGGEEISAELQKRYKDVLKIDIRVGYGLTETTSIASWNELDRKNKPGSAGRSMPWNAIKIVQGGEQVSRGRNGEILVKGVNVVKEYFDREDKTNQYIAEEWFHTGDIGYLDHEGNLYIRGRKKDMIIKGGLNIYPKEVEKIIKQHPHVHEVKIFSYRLDSIDSSVSETLEAVVSVSKSSGMTANSLKKWCRQNISNYKVPDKFVLKYV